MNDSEAILPQAATRHRRFSLIWLIPIIAAAIAAFLAYRTLSARGPLVTISFRSADGLTAGQTVLRYRAVSLGSVEAIRLTPDRQRVTVEIRMRGDAGLRLTDRARFWVVRPRITLSGVSGLDTLLSGAYITLDPGHPGGAPELNFTGLEEPPGVRSDEPGRVVRLRSSAVGALGRGSPVFFRNVTVGEVLSFNPPGLDGDISLQAFIRAPYDAYVRRDSRFWNASGLQIRLGAQGVRVEIESLEAVLNGGIAFDTPVDRPDPEAEPDAEFTLYEDQGAAMAATSPDRMHFLVYFDGTMSGLSAGAPVQMRGITIGRVTSLRLEFDRAASIFRVPVRIEVEPHRIAFPAGRPHHELRIAAEELVARGMRARLQSGSLITGQMLVSLDLIPDAPPASIRLEGDEIVLPSLPSGGLDGIMTQVSGILSRVDRLPLDQIGHNLDGAIASLNGLVSGPEMAEAVRALAATMVAVQDVARRFDLGTAPVLRRLPALADNIDRAVARANTALGSFETGYGRGSETQRQIDRLLAQLTDTARSIRLLADFLDRHPEALIRGRTGGAAER